LIASTELGLRIAEAGGALTVLGFNLGAGMKWILC
jgi:hypothetical protein